MPQLHKFQGYNREETLRPEIWLRMVLRPGFPTTNNFDEPAFHFDACKEQTTFRQLRLATCGNLLWEYEREISN